MKRNKISKMAVITCVMFACVFCGCSIEQNNTQNEEILDVISDTTLEAEPTAMVEMSFEEQVAAEDFFTYYFNETEDAIVYLNWKRPEGVEKFELYRKEDEGEFHLIYEESGIAELYTDGVAMLYGEVQYYLRAFKDGKWAESKIIKITAPEIPYGTKISNINDDGIEYYWKFPEKIDGIEVFRSYEREGEYVKIAECSKHDDTYCDTEYDASQKAVFYKCRSFCEVDGVRVYSKLSESKKAKYKETLELEGNKFFVRSGEVRKIMAYIGWGEAHDLIWESSNPDIAMVDEHGVVTGVSAGECEVTAYLAESDTIVGCQVIIDRKADAPIQEITSDYRKEKGMWVKKEPTDSECASVVVVGDMMCTGSQQKMQGYETGDFNFNESYDYVKDIISEADFALGNLETLVSPSWPYMHDEAYINGKPNCNAPARYLDAIKYAGFDGVVMSNNHNCDGGVRGLIETVVQVERYDIARTGLFKTKEEDRGMLVDVNGIRLGVLSYSSPQTGFNKKDATWDEADVDEKLNYYTKEKVQQDVSDLRARGAEYIIVYMHWGVKTIKK